MTKTEGGSRLQAYDRAIHDLIQERDLICSLTSEVWVLQHINDVLMELRRAKAAYMDELVEEFEERSKRVGPKRGRHQSAVFRIYDANDNLVGEGTADELEKATGIESKLFYRAAKGNYRVKGLYKVEKESLKMAQANGRADLPKRLDVGKIRALHNAGWSDEKIAEEMQIDEATIKQILKEEDRCYI